MLHRIYRVVAIEDYLQQFNVVVDRETGGESASILGQYGLGIFAASRVTSLVILTRCASYFFINF